VAVKKLALSEGIHSRSSTLSLSGFMVFFEKMDIKGFFCRGQSLLNNHFVKHEVKELAQKALRKLKKDLR
jgi:hypothetical protein